MDFLPLGLGLGRGHGGRLDWSPMPSARPDSVCDGAACTTFAFNVVWDFFFFALGFVIFNVTLDFFAFGRCGPGMSGGSAIGAAPPAGPAVPTSEVMFGVFLDFRRLLRDRLGTAGPTSGT